MKLSCPFFLRVQNIKKVLVSSPFSTSTLILWSNRPKFQVRNGCYTKNISKASFGDLRIIIIRVKGTCEIWKLKIETKTTSNTTNEYVLYPPFSLTDSNSLFIKVLTSLSITQSLLTTHLSYTLSPPSFTHQFFHYPWSVPQHGKRPRTGSLDPTTVLCRPHLLPLVLWGFGPETLWSLGTWYLRGNPNTVPVFSRLLL